MKEKRQEGQGAVKGKQGKPVREKEGDTSSISGRRHDISQRYRKRGKRRESNREDSTNRKRGERRTELEDGKPVWTEMDTALGRRQARMTAEDAAGLRRQ